METDDMMINEAPSWDTVFRKSRLAGCVFNVDADHYGEARQLAEEAGLPTALQSGLYSSFIWSTPLLDGFVIQLSKYGWGPGLPSGERVVGFRAFRLLCHLMGLRPPRRLKGEPSVPTTDELLSELAAQVVRPEAELNERAQVALDIKDRTQLLQVVRDCYGDNHLPSTGDEVILDLRALGPWGNVGATERTAPAFVAAGESGVGITDRIDELLADGFGRS